MVTKSTPNAVTRSEMRDLRRESLFHILVIQVWDVFLYELHNLIEDNLVFRAKEGREYTFG